MKTEEKILRDRIKELERGIAEQRKVIAKQAKVIIEQSNYILKLDRELQTGETQHGTGNDTSRNQRSQDIKG